MKRNKRRAGLIDERQTVLNHSSQGRPDRKPLNAFRLGYLAHSVRLECVFLLKHPARPMHLSLVLELCNDMHEAVIGLKMVMGPSSYSDVGRAIDDLKNFARGLCVRTATRENPSPDHTEDDLGGMVLRLETESERCLQETPKLLLWYRVGAALGDLVLLGVEDLYFAAIRPQPSLDRVIKLVRQLPATELAAVAVLRRLVRLDSQLTGKRNLRSQMMQVLKISNPLDVIDAEEIQSLKDIQGLTRRIDLEKWFALSITHNMICRLVGATEDGLSRMTESSAPSRSVSTNAPGGKRRVRDRMMDARNKWIYEELLKGEKTFKEVLTELPTKEEFGECRAGITTIGGLRYAANTHAKLHNKPVLARQDRATDQSV